MPAAAVPVAVPAVEAVPAEAPIGELFSQYQAGAPTDLFAPAYIRGFAPAEQAVDAWRSANRGITRADLEQTRMPQIWRDNNIPVPGGYGPYGQGNIPHNIAFGGDAIDPEALRAMAQGGQYDLGARRNAITERLLYNQELKNIAVEQQKRSMAAAAAMNPWANVGQPTMLTEYQND